MASDASPQPSPMDVENDEICWICLDENNEHLMVPCKCPRKVHPKCLARWQLQQAGKPEETHCRFCNHALADWKSSLTPDNLKPDVQRVQPIMVVYFEGQIHRIPVKQGSEGLREFTDRIRELFRLPEDIDISLTFGCKEPMSGNHLKLEGIGAFDAAVHCASVAAAERQQKLRTTSSGGGAVSSGGSSNSGAGTPPALSPPSQQSLTGPATPNGQPQVAPYAHHHRRATTSVLPSVDHASLAAAEQQLQLAHQQHAARAGIPTLAFPPLPPVQQHMPLPPQHHSMHQLPSQIGAADSYGTPTLPQRTRARSTYGLARTVSAAAAIPDPSLAHGHPQSRGHAVSSFAAASAIAAADPSAPLTPAPAPRGVFSSIARRRMHFSASRASSSGGSSSDAAADMGTPFYYDPQSTADEPCTSPMDVDEQQQADSSSRASSREADIERAAQRIIASPRTSHRTIDSSSSDSQHSTPSSDDNTVAVGSLTGRLKYSLKAFSRKVARSLTLRPTAGGPAPAAGSPIGAATVPDACL